MALAFPTLPPTFPHLPTYQKSEKGLSLKLANACDISNERISTRKTLGSSNRFSLIDSCDCLHLGRQIHAHAVKSGSRDNGFLENRIMVMYGRCSALDDAYWVFHNLVKRDMYSLVGMLSVYADNGCFEEAGELLPLLVGGDVELEFFLFPVALKICGALGATGVGRELHGFVVKRYFLSNVYVGNSLIDFYGKCRMLDDAQKVFDRLIDRDIVSWNAVVTNYAANGVVSGALGFLKEMRAQHISPNLVSYSGAIGGFVQNGHDFHALELLHQMQADGIKPNSRTLASVLSACARLRSISMGKEIHGYLTRQFYMHNPFVVNALMDVYRRCSCMHYVESLFWQFSTRNSMSFNTMIVGYFETGEVNVCVDLFRQMEVYGIEKDTTTWNSMISGFVSSGMYGEALKLFREMMVEGFEPDSFTMGSVLSACADLPALSFGKQIHGLAIIAGLECHPIIRNALVETYCRCNDLASAQLIFEETSERDTSMWNSIISGHARCGNIDHARKLIDQMRSTGVEPNMLTWNGLVASCVENGDNSSALQLVSSLHYVNLKPDIYMICILISSSSRIASIEQGRKVHGYAMRHGYDKDVYIGSALIDMYAKCGSIKHACLAFNRVSKHNLVSWNAMLAGYTMHGCGKESIAVFLEMQQLGITADSVTFLSVLSACAHSRLVDEGWRFFELMKDYGIQPTLKHYASMVDLLSRAGLIRKAFELIKGMEMDPDSVIWGALLSGCVDHQETEIGEIAAQRLIDLEPCKGANYVLLANLYASGGRWDDLARTRQKMNEERFSKNPGCSWIEISGNIHPFYAGDVSHLQWDEVYATLRNLACHMRKDIFVQTQMEATY